MQSDVNISSFNAIQQTVAMRMHMSTSIHQKIVAKSTKQLPYYTINAIT